MVLTGSSDVPADAPAEVPVRPAATVMLLRDAVPLAGSARWAGDAAHRDPEDQPGLEVFVLRRVAAMDFAAGMTVFPGGGVDEADHAAGIGWAGPDADWWATALGAEPEKARGLVVAAVRELFEETGVLLATPVNPGAPTVYPDDATRLAILHRQRVLPDVLAAAGLQLRADLLRPWANWITPPGRTRRYDTFFFAAALPAGQEARMLTTEAESGLWRTPEALLAEHAVRATALMPPTVAMLTDLAGFGSVAEVMAAPRVVTPVRVRAADVRDIDVASLGHARGGGPKPLSEEGFLL